jgi:glutathionylspermidine synthase
MQLSNKSILPIPWGLFPYHANLLECYFGGPKRMTGYVKKPRLSREGANLSIHRGDTVAATGGPYGEDGFVYQAIAPAAHYEGAYPILGSWMIDGIAAGIGIRESQTPTTSNLSSFVPHLFE